MNYIVRSYTYTTYFELLSKTLLFSIHYHTYLWTCLWFHKVTLVHPLKTLRIFWLKRKPFKTALKSFTENIARLNSNFNIQVYDINSTLRQFLHCHKRLLMVQLNRRAFFLWSNEYGTRLSNKRATLVTLLSCLLFQSLAFSLNGFCGLFL